MKNFKVAAFARFATPTAVVLVLATTFFGCASSDTFIGPGGAQTTNQFKQPFQDFYFKRSDWKEANDLRDKYKVLGEQMALPKAIGTSVTLTRAGKTSSIPAAMLLQTLKSAKSDDVIRLGEGQYEVIATSDNEILGSGVTIVGDPFKTVLKVQGIKFTTAVIQNLTLNSANFSVQPPHRVWLENVRLLNSYNNRTAWAASMPKGSAVVAIMGGFLLEPLYCGGGDVQRNACLAQNQGFGSYLSTYNLGAVSINAAAISQFSQYPELKPFFTEYLNYISSNGSKPKPSVVNATRAWTYARRVIEGGTLQKQTHLYTTPAETTQINDLTVALWTRLASLLEREFEAGGMKLPKEEFGKRLQLATGAIQQGLPLTALFLLQALNSENVGEDGRKEIQKQISSARSVLAKQYGTAIDYRFTGSHTEPAGLMHKSTKEAVEGRNRAALIDAVVIKYPIVRLAEDTAARFRVTIEQTRNDFSSTISNQKVEERTMVIEDPSVRAARQKAAADAAWAKFQSAMSNINATASAIEKTARTNYEQRVRVEDTATGKQMVWYEGKTNQGALNLSNPSLGYSLPPPGMLEVTATTKRYLYNNIVNVAFQAKLSDGRKVIDSLAPFTKTQSWNFSCKTEKAPNSIGAMMENSDCFGGTGGRSGGDINEIVMREIFGKWIHGHFENRVIPENIHRLERAAKSKNKAEVAEMILLGRGLGIASSKEQEEVLREVFGTENAFEKVLSVTTIQ